MNTQQKEKRLLMLAYIMLFVSLGYLVMILIQSMNSGIHIDTNFLLRVLPPVFLAISALLQVVSMRLKMRTPK